MFDEAPEALAVHLQIDVHADHEHTEERVGVPGDLGEDDHGMRQGEVQERHDDHDQIDAERDGRKDVAQETLDGQML